MWVMTERKVIRSGVPVPGSQHPPTVNYVDKVFDVGDPAPAGHERRPYTREVKVAPRTDMGERIEDPAPNRMAKPSGHARKAKK